MAKKHDRLSFVFLAVLFVCVGTANVFAAQEERFPSKPIKLIIGGGPGTSIDVTMRALSKAAEKVLGQPIVCTNTTGAGGNRALGSIMNEKADGYTLASLTSGTVMTSIAEKMKWDIATDFTPIMNAQDHPVPVAVKKDSPWKSWQDLIKTAREQPGSIRIGNFGPKGRDWLVMTQLGRKENVKFLFVPFSGPGESITAILGDHINVNTHVSSILYAKSGELKVLLFFSDKRLKSFPDVPTAIELYGDLPGFRSSIAGVVGPKGLPGEVHATLSNAYKKGLEDEEYRKVLETFDISISYKGPEDFIKHIKHLQAAVREGLAQGN